MDTLQLRQKRYLETREYELRNKEIHVKFRKSYEQTEWTIPFDELGFKKVYQSNPRTLNNIIVGGIGILLGAMTIAYIFQEESMEDVTFYMNWVIWSIVATIFLFVGKKNEVFLTGGSQNLSFFRNIPSEDEVDKFLDELIRRAKNHLKTKYTKIDKDLSEDIQLNNFYWLRNIEIISEDEFEQLKSELKTQKLM